LRNKDCCIIFILTITDVVCHLSTGCGAATLFNVLVLQNVVDIKLTIIALDVRLHLVFEIQYEANGSNMSEVAEDLA